MALADVPEQECLRGSAPESGKKTFLWKMRKELSAAIKEFPKATVVSVADGA